MFQEWVLFNTKYFISVHKVRYCKPINLVEPKNLLFLLLLTVFGKFSKGIRMNVRTYHMRMPFLKKVQLQFKLYMKFQLEQAL